MHFYGVVPETLVVPEGIRGGEGYGAQRWPRHRNSRSVWESNIQYPFLAPMAYQL